MGEAELVEQFPFLDFEDESAEEVTPTVFVQEDKSQLVDLFLSVFRPYIRLVRRGQFELNMTIVVPVLQEEKLPLAATLADLAQLWEGYNSLLLEKFSE